MKIAYLSPFYPYRGGIAQFNDNLLPELQQLHQVQAYNFKRQYPDFLFPGKTQYVDNPDPQKASALPRLLDTANPFSYLSTASTLAAFAPDCLLMRYWMSYFSPSQGTVARKLRHKGCKTVSILDNVLPHEPKFFDKPFTKWFLSQQSGCVCMCEATQDDLLRLAPDKPHILLPHPLYNHFGPKMDPLQARRQLGLDPSKKTLLFFGLIRDYKGLDLLIDAVDALEEDVQLVVAGECYSSGDKYTQQIARLAHPQRVHMYNQYISDDRVPLFFGAADACVLPYRSATQSGIVAIAYHFETPMIATPVGGLAESVERPGAGIMATGITAPQLREAVEHFFTMDAQVFVSQIKELKKQLTWGIYARKLTDFICAI